MPALSLSVRIAAVSVANVVIATGAALVLVQAGLQPPVAALLVLLVMVPFAIASTSYVSRRVAASAEALMDGVRALHDRDLSMRLTVEPDDDLRELKQLYNEVADVMRAERNEIYQKELLLDTVLQRTPVGVVLVNAAERIIYSNAAARDVLSPGGRLDGRHFAEVSAQLVPPMREALAASADVIFSIDGEGERAETFHVSQRVFHLNTQRHRLVLVERLTPELRRQEVMVWKKAIRIMNHELNNTVAPISSLFHSARRAQQMPEHHHKLDEIYATIEERLGYLRMFLESYAQFARLPEPRREPVRWIELLHDVRALYDFRLAGALPEAGNVDRAQMQQVLINLLKNAHESGCDPDEIVLAIDRIGDGTVIRIHDRGRGMSDEVMRQALLPFYSTKPGGSGLGLALSNEIIEAHGGRLRLEAREGGGTAVTAWLP